VVAVCPLNSQADSNKQGVQSHNQQEYARRLKQLEKLLAAQLGRGSRNEKNGSQKYNGVQAQPRQKAAEWVSNALSP